MPAALTETTAAWIGAVLSGLIGALIGAGAAILTQRSGWKREDAHRWDQERRRVYAAYIALAEEAYRIGTYRALDAADLSDQEATAFRDAWEKAGTAEFEVRLVCGPVLVPPIDKLN